MAFSAYLSARPIVLRVALAVGLLALVLGLSLGLSEIATKATDERAEMKTALERYAAQWQSRVGARLSAAISLATSAGTFAAANVTEPLNHNGTVAERLRITNPALWNVTADALFDQVPGMLSLQLQPSGIIAQFWPPGSAPFGLDTLNLPHLREGYLQLAREGIPRVYGPITLAQGGIGVLARFPVYASEPRSLATWWGAGVAVFRVSELLTAMNILPEFEQDGYEFVCYAVNMRNASAPPQVVLTSAGAVSVDTHGVTLRDGYVVRLETTDPNNALFLTVQPRAGLPSGTPTSGETVIVVVPTLAGAIALAGLVLLFVLVGFVARHRRVPSGHADGNGKPAAMVLVSVKRMGWWSERQEPSQLQADLIAFEREAGSLAESHGCHLSGRLSEGCAFVVASSCEAAHAFAIAANEKLPRRFCNLPIRKAGEAAVIHDRRTATRTSHPRSAAAHSHPRARSTIQARSATGRRSAADENSQMSGSTRTSNTRVSDRSDRNATHGNFEFAVTLHHGQLRSTYDAETDRHTFFGSCIASAALAVDATQAGEVTASEAFATACGWTLVPRSTPSRTLDDGESSFLLVGDLTGTDASGSDEEKKVKRRSANEGSVATALSAKTGATVRKRVAVLAVELLPDEGYTSKDRNGPVPNLTEALEHMLGEVQRLKGDLVSVQDTRVLFAFNALQPVTSPAQRAAAADMAVRSVLGPKRRVVSVIALGFGFVAQAHGSVLLSGDAPFRARLLLREALVTDAAEHGALEHAAMCDALTAEELRQAYELQCIGLFGSRTSDVGAYGTAILTRGVAPSLAFAVERPWPDENDAADDEWLYKLQRFESMSPFTPLNAAFEAAAAGKLQPQEAEAVLARPDATTFNPAAVAALKRLAGLQLQAAADTTATAQ